MTLIERLRKGSMTSAPYEPQYTVPPVKICLEAADEIERLTAEEKMQLEQIVNQGLEIERLTAHDQFLADANKQWMADCERLTAELARAKEYHAGELADVVAELATANSIKVEQIDYAIGLQRAIEAHCREDVAPDDVCPHHAEKLNGHFNRQQVLEKEHKEFYDEVVKLRTIVEHLRLREDHLTAELAEMKADRDSLSVAAALWNHRYIDACQQHADRQTNLGHEIVALGAERDALRAALHSISLASQDSGSTKEGMGLYARAAIAGAGK